MTKYKDNYRMSGEMLMEKYRRWSTVNNSIDVERFLNETTREGKYHGMAVRKFYSLYHASLFKRVRPSDCYDWDHSLEKSIIAFYEEGCASIWLQELLSIQEGKEHQIYDEEGMIILHVNKQEAEQLLDEYEENWDKISVDQQGAFYHLRWRDLWEDYKLCDADAGDFDTYVQEFEHQEGYLHPGAVLICRELYKLENGKGLYV